MKLIVYNSLFSSNEYKTPVLSLKPDTALLRNNNAFFIPDFSSDIEYGIYLVIKISKMGKCISPVFAHRYYEEIGIGVNFTARDLLQECIQQGLTHEIAYAFDNSSAISLNFIKKSVINDQTNFGLKVNDQWLQLATIGDMQMNLERIISEASQRITLKIGDYIFAGSPPTLGKAKIGDHLQGFLNDQLLLDFTIQ